MVRLRTDNRTDDEETPLQVLWNGTQERADTITEWCRDSAYNVRFSYNPRLHFPDEARVLIEHGFPESSSWEKVPVGAVIERENHDKDAKLRLVLPSKEAA